MRKVLLLAAVTACATVAFAIPALAADGPVKTFSQDVTLGYYRGQLISYLDFGPVNLKPGNKTAPIWAFTNGDQGQRNIIDTVPGRTDYSPLWLVHMVTWKQGANTRTLRSAAAVRAAQKAGQVTIKATPVVVNCPVL